MNLQTTRLILRQPEVDDAAAYTAIHNTEFVLRYNAMAPTTAERMAAKFQDQEYRENTVFLENRESGALVGAIFLEDDDLRYGVDSKSLSYFVAEEYSRKIGFPIFVGVEFFSLQGDITGFGVDTFPDQRVSAQEFIEALRQGKGQVIKQENVLVKNQ